MVELAALEKRYGATHRGFESLSLRHKKLSETKFMLEPSIFTKIIRGDIPGEIIYQDELVAVLLTIEPLTPGHMLVVPKEQLDPIWDADEELYGHLWSAARHMANHLQNVFGYERIGTIVEGFGVSHAHIHVFGYEEPLEPMITGHIAKKNHKGGVVVDQAALKTVAEKLRA